MNKAIYPGTFDPVTYGHIDVIERALKIFDQVIVACAHNPRKNPLFSVAERIGMLKEATKDLPASLSMTLMTWWWTMLKTKV